MSGSLGVPQQIGRYRVEKILGRGAMGVIYKAHDPVIDRPVALKLVNANLLDGDERADYVARFQQEAQAAGRCSHPNIVSVYDFALHDGNPYLALEFIDGITLGQVERNHKGFGLPEIADITAQALDGLAAAHALGVIHRDIKPANIMLTVRGQVKVTDFGISRIDSSLLTGAGAIMGTPSYMSPEQCRGLTVDARSDLFSMGVLLYELITGRKPFTGQSQHEIWRQLLEEEPPDPVSLRPDAPAALIGVIYRSLAKAPDARFGSAAEMALALRAAMTPGGTVMAPLSDLTVVARLAPTAGLQIDSTTMITIERRLAHYVGPIANLLVKSAARTSGSVEALCLTLAANIEQTDKRAQFSNEVQLALGQTMTSPPATLGGVKLSDSDLQQAQLYLTKYLGPVARVLVKRGAAGCGSVAELWQRLARHIEKPADRAEFLRRLPTA